MALTTTHLNVPLANAPLGTFTQSGFQLIQQARSKLAEAQRRRAIYRTTFAELDALSDRHLNDLGLSRHGVRDVAQQTAYGDQ